MATPAFISALKSDRCLHYLNDSLINRAQSIDVNAQVPTQLIDELGNPAHAGAVSAPAEVSFSVSVFDTGVDLVRSLTGKPAATTFALGDFAGARVDYVGVVRDNAGHYFRSVYVRNACIGSIGYSYDTAGNAVESFNFLGDNLTVFDGFVVTKKYVIQASDAANQSFALPIQGEELPVRTLADSYFGGAYLLRVAKTADGAVQELIEGNDYSYDPAERKISASGLAAGQEWTLVFYSAKPAAPLAPGFATAAPPAVRGEFTPVSIGVNAKTWIPRLQSARIQVDLGQRKISQLGSRQVLYAPGGVPNVSGDFNVLMNDLSLRRLLTYGAASGTETQFGVEQLPAYGARNDLGLEAVIKSPVDNSVLKRITVPGIVTVSGGMPATVNGNLTESFAWTGRTGELTIANS